MEESTLQAVLLACVCLTTTVFLISNILRRQRQRSQPPTPPSPPSLPLIGHLHLLSGDIPPHHTFTHLAHKLGPIIHLQLGQVPTVIISSPHLAQLILQTHDTVFANRPQLISAQYLSFGCSDITFSPYGPYWRQARKICVTEMLSSKRVHSFQSLRDEETNRMVRLISTLSDCEVDMSRVFFTVANDILCRVAFGKRFMTNNNNISSEISQEESGEGEVYAGLITDGCSDLVSVLTEAQALFAGFCVGDFFPEWEWVNSVSGMKRRLMKNLKDLRKVCEEIIEEHVMKRRDDLRKEDFVDVLLKVQKRDGLEVPITDDNLKALVLDMFVAGTDTTSAVLEWTMTELARHPSVLRRAQDQVRRIAANRGKVEEADLQHLNYMKAVIKESMRLHPPVPLLVPRESMAKCTLDGYEIPAKTRILINTYAIGRDPESWKDPLEYNPERFLDKDIDYRGLDFRFLPFGGGRRGCPGYSLGLATIELSLARLLYHFDWKLPPGIGSQDVDMSEIFGLATRKRLPLKLVPTINTLYAIGEED